MSKQLDIQVVDRLETLWAGKAGYISVPALDGKLGVLPGRQPVLAVLGSGAVEISQVQNGDADVLIDVDSGFVSVDADFVTVVVEDGTVISS